MLSDSGNNITVSGQNRPQCNLYRDRLHHRPSVVLTLSVRLRQYSDIFMVQPVVILPRSLIKALRPARFVGTVALIIAGTGQAVADQSISAELIDKAGIIEHLAMVPDSIAKEAWSKHKLCHADDAVTLSPSDEADFKALIQQHFGVEQSQARAIQAMSENLNVKQLYATKKFFDSDLGERIVAAERASKNISEAEFVSIAEDYLDSEQWNEERKKVVNLVYASTRAARFVSILNGELTVASEVSGHCKPTLESYKTLSKHLKTTRSDARLIENFMANDLILIIATVFRDIPNKDLVEYIEFARGSDGKSFFNALMESTRLAISGGLKGVRDERIADYEESISTAESGD